MGCIIISNYLFVNSLKWEVVNYFHNRKVKIMNKDPHIMKDKIRILIYPLLLVLDSLEAEGVNDLTLGFLF